MQLLALRRSHHSAHHSTAHHPTHHSTAHHPTHHSITAHHVRASERFAHKGDLGAVAPRTEVLKQLDALEGKERHVGQLLHAFGAAEEPAVGGDDAQRPAVGPGELELPY